MQLNKTHTPTCDLGHEYVEENESGYVRKLKIKVRKITYREFVGRRTRKREVDVEGHGATKSWAEMLVPLVESSKHL